MKIENKVLKKVLERAGKGGLDKDSNIEFKIIADKQCLVVTTVGHSQQNIIQQVKCTVDDGEESWEGRINYSIVSSLVNKYSKDETSMIKEENKIVVKNGRSKSTLPLVDEQLSLFEIKENPTKLFELTVGQWEEGIKPVLYALAQDDTRPILKGALLECDNGYTNVVTLDGFRVAKSTLDIDCDLKEKISLIIDGTTLKAVSDISSKFDKADVIKIMKTDSKVIFTIVNCSIISATLSGDYVDYKKILPSIDDMNKVSVSKKELLETLERVNVALMSTKTNIVKLNIEPDKIKIVANSELAKVDDELSCNGDVSLEIAFNTHFLIDALKNINEEKIDMYFTSGLQPCMIKVEKKVALILPVRTAN